LIIDNRFLSIVHLDLTPGVVGIRIVCGTFYSPCMAYLLLKVSRRLDTFWTDCRRFGTISRLCLVNLRVIPYTWYLIGVCDAVSSSCFHLCLAEDVFHYGKVVAQLSHVCGLTWYRNHRSTREDFSLLGTSFDNSSFRLGTLAMSTVMGFTLFLPLAGLLPSASSPHRPSHPSSSASDSAMVTIAIIQKT
jgi:hypothetical protein